MDLELLDVNDIRNPNGRMSIHERPLHARIRKMLPDELQHQQFVKIRVQQRANDRIEFPIVVMRALGEVNDHRRRAALWSGLGKQ